MNIVNYAQISYADLEDIPLEKKQKEDMILCCDCMSRTSRDNQIIEGIFNPTEVTVDNICVHCGYYAYLMPASFFKDVEKRRGVNRGNFKKRKA